MEKKKKKIDSDGLWSEGFYAKKLDPANLEERMKFFHQDPNEEKMHQCTSCNKSIGKHNLYWHEGMCDDCFFRKYNL